MDIIGTLPKILANKMDDTDGIVIRGNDIDLSVYNHGTTTHLEAMWLGNGRFEVMYLMDNLNLFPSYDEGDVIPLEAVGKVLNQLQHNQIMSSLNPIMSISLKGKIKDKLKEKREKRQQERDAAKQKMKDRLDWLTDKLDIGKAQEVVRQQEGFERAKVGVLDLVDKKDGKNYKALSGNPPTQDYQVWLLHRNGNDIRVEDSWIELTKDQAVATFRNLAGTVDIPEDNEPVTGTTEEGAEYTVIDAALKRKKSKCNGMNVTGCEDGNLVGEATVVASSLIFSNFSEFIEATRNKSSGENEDLRKIKFKLLEILRKSPKVAKLLSDNSTEEYMKLDFSKIGMNFDYNIQLKFTKDGTFVCCDAGYRDLSQGELLKLTFSSLDMVINKL